MLNISRPRGPADPVAEALAQALKVATEAGEWATVANLAEQLRQRQPTAPRAAIVDLQRERDKRR
jgi:thiazole synthase ThiGH ThiG subunit